MYSVNKYEDKFTMYELREDSTNSWVRVCPERGGIITSFGINGRELLYMDKETFYNSSANIRGGIPILFPISGQLIDGRYELKGNTYFMKNHGVARITPWEVKDTSMENEASISLVLKSSEETRKAFPFEFELIFTYVLKHGRLTINQEYHNFSDEAMPLQAGFHPYFQALSKNLAYETDAEKYLDYNDMKVKSYTGSIDLTDMVESAAFLDAEENRIAFEISKLNRKIVLDYGTEFKYVVVWSVKDKDFICVEPWMGKNAALNTKEGLQYVEAGNCLRTYFNLGASFAELR